MESESKNQKRKRRTRRLSFPAALLELGAVKNASDPDPPPTDPPSPVASPPPSSSTTTTAQSKGPTLQRKGSILRKGWEKEVEKEKAEREKSGKVLKSIDENDNDDDDDDEIEARQQQKGKKGRFFVTNDVSKWSEDEVANWLKSRGYEAYADNFVHNKIDGEILLALTEGDISKRLGVNILGDAKRLYKLIERLGRSSFSLSPRGRGADDSHVDSPQDAKGGSLPLPRRNRIHSSPSLLHAMTDEDRVRIAQDHYPDNDPEPIEEGKVIFDWIKSRQFWPFGEPKRPASSQLYDWQRKEPLSASISKLAISIFYGLLVSLITSFVMTIVGDRVPDPLAYPPLPDIVLDSIPLIPIAFTMAESIIVAEGIMLGVICLCHRHRVVIGRRFFAITGTVFLLRCATMFITSLSVPGTHLDCPAGRIKTVDDINWQELMTRTWEIFAGVGMSINGVRTCGDYMFSGHTSIMTILNFFILEYSPSNWRGLHILSWVFNLFGMFFVLAAHEHYSIDVFMAYYISSHLFVYYHNMANSIHLFQKAGEEMTDYFPLFSYLEEHTKGVIPNEYGI